MSIASQQIALITGGSSGIGLEVARQLSQQGAHVWLVGRDADRLGAALEMVEAARSEGGQHFGVTAADVSDPAQAQEAVEQVSRQIGLPHLVVNSAGVAQPGYFQELEPELFTWMMQINYFGTVNVCKAVIPAMVARGSGHVVNICSFVAVLSVFGYTAYAGSKWAVRGFTDVLRAEMKPRGIRVSIVFPPDVDTPQLAYESQFRPAETRALVALSGVMTPQAVASSILRGVRRGQYIILPGLENKVLYWLVGMAGKAAYPILDLVQALVYKMQVRKSH